MFKSFYMPERVVKLVNWWGLKSKRTHQKNKLEFLDRMGNKLVWDNVHIEEGGGLIEKEAGIHHVVTAEIPGVLVLESDYENNIGPGIKSILAPAYAEQAVAAWQNANPDNDRSTNIKTTGVDWTSPLIEIDQAEDNKSNNMHMLMTCTNKDADL